MKFSEVIELGRKEAAKAPRKTRKPTAPLRELTPFENAIALMLDRGSVIGTSQEATPRMYIGGSSIGHSCDRLLALSIRGFPSNELTARQVRIFRDGHRIEEQVLADMKAARLHILPPSLDGPGQHFAHIGGGFARAHMDGLLMIPTEKDGSGRVTVLEIKSMAKAYWTATRRHGVRAKYPGYYAQMQWYMHLWLKANPERQALFSGEGMFVAANKDTGEYLVEMVPYSEEYGDKLWGRFTRIGKSGTGDRISERPEFWECGMCLKSNACHQPKTVTLRACSLCRHSVPAIGAPGNDRKWVCELHQREATKTCDQYEVYGESHATGQT